MRGYKPRVRRIHLVGAALVGATVVLFATIQMVAVARADDPVADILSKLPTYKRESMKQELAWRAGQPQPAQTPGPTFKKDLSLADVGTPVPANVPRTPAGAGTIVENGGFPLAALPPYKDLFQFTNYWYQQNARGRQVGVYAGAEKKDPSQGVVVVRVTLPSGNFANPPTPAGPDDKGGLYPTPVKAGILRVVGATGERITLESENGTKFVFDVPTRRFISP